MCLRALGPSGNFKVSCGTRRGSEWQVELNSLIYPPGWFVNLRVSFVWCGPFRVIDVWKQRKLTCCQGKPLFMMHTHLIILQRNTYMQIHRALYNAVVDTWLCILETLKYRKCNLTGWSINRMFAPSTKKLYCMAGFPWCNRGVSLKLSLVDK